MRGQSNSSIEVVRSFLLGCGPIAVRLSYVLYTTGVMNMGYVEVFSDDHLLINVYSMS